MIALINPSDPAFLVAYRVGSTLPTIVWESIILMTEYNPFKAYFLMSMLGSFRTPISLGMILVLNTWYSIFFDNFYRLDNASDFSFGGQSKHFM